ncbi:hypothetical protein IDH44_18405 [Paenibacillus sp. IB182496]|uniref:Uncharacterized protein n=1 Tax=Paenibacillus sabuli TaxID=2772509 RepID=A0A927BWH3_9BACL|nr:hypothetical protein [Paenibacillus sabuli]MBD2847176.1 hypothetical protein [Paenibacillus sabuli]
MFIGSVINNLGSGLYSHARYGRQKADNAVLTTLPAFKIQIACGTRPA